ncbi:hypothetical protein DPMN_002355 [Dreissena polymorpha]|uniref:Uncharacterized protein n=1 Tax=Dreissena polymorpha TaxID=45954 RepID=A0A9D4RR55_DREPO|nr:hypothetical protein DPMN_002355 [Dreissena polymorpha]
MATVRQYDGDNAIERWRHCDDTTATVRYDYRVVAPISTNAYPLRVRTAPSAIIFKTRTHAHVHLAGKATTVIRIPTNVQLRRVRTAPHALIFRTRTRAHAHRADINECAPAPCKNGATCNNLQNAYSCTCSPGWQGNNCDQDCGFPPDIPNGIITLFDESNTTYGALAKGNCTSGYEHTQHIIQCATSGWENTSCEPHDCGPTPSLQNGFVQTSDGTTFGKTAVYAWWPLIGNLCVIKDCGQLKNPSKGKVDMSTGSTYQAVARYTCNRGYDLIRDEKRMCQSTGTWSGIQPSCISEEQTKVVCKTNVDIRGTEWKEVIQGSTRVQQCAEGFEGNITRVCLNDGTWQLSQYNCVRKSVKDVAEKVEAFVSNATADTVSNALEQIVNVTGNEETTNTLELLTDAEITVLANSLAKVAEIVVNKSLPTEHVVKSVSNLVDEQNKQSWETMKQHNSYDIKIDQHQDQIRAKTSDSSIRLKAKAIGDTEVIVTVVIYKDMSHVLPNTSETPIGVKTKDQQINGPILSLSLSNHFGKLNPPVLLTFERMKANLTSPVCSYWTFGRKKAKGHWSSDGCVLLNSDEHKTVCQCDHLTNFAVLMSPFVEADAASVPLRTLSTVGMGISMACLLITMLTYIYLWRFLKSDRTILLLNLCGALMLSYIIFLAGVDKTASKALCATTAVFLHYIYLVVFCLMLAEGIDIVIMAVYVFITKSRLKPLLITAWVSPAVIVVISLLSTQADGYGNEKL